MATESSGTDINQFTCGICMDNYQTPRYLPTCGHTFCEKCLLTHASNLQQQGSRLECPVCRKTLSFPENNQVTLEWIQTFPLNSVIVKMMESGLGSAEQKTTEVKEARRECDPCKERGETVVGLKFCMDCQEVYCKTCTDSHKAFKISKHHTLIDTREIPTEAGCTDLFKDFAKCPNHPEWDIELFCKTHDVVICAICAAHCHDKTCDIVGVLNHDSDATNLREESEKLAFQMKEALDHLNMLKSLREENKKSLKKKLKKIRDDIEQVRDQVVTLMDNMVRHVAEVTKQIEIENEDRIDEELSGISKIKEQVEESVTRLDTVSQHGTEKHKFILSHLMKRQMEEVAIKITEQDRHLKDIGANMKTADAIRELMKSTDVEALAQVVVNESESRHKHFGGISNYLRDSKLVKIERHTVRPNTKHHPVYWGIAMHKDGRVMLGDNCKTNGCGYFCLYNPSDRTMMKLKLNNPYSITQIDETRIAVSVPDNNAINIVSVGNEIRVEKTLKPRSTPLVIIALSNNQLAVAFSCPQAFSVIDISGAEIVQKLYLDQDKSGRKFNSFLHMAVDEKRQHVIQTCIKDNIVYCFDFTGEPVFGYSNPGLSDPGNVALDACGNLYVCNTTDTGSIYKLSPEGQLLSIITGGVPSYPYSICSDLSGTGFWVTQLDSSLVDQVVHFRLEQNTEP